MSRALGIVLGHLADRRFGDPRRGHPVAIFGGAAAALERRTYADSRARGAAHLILLAGAVAGGGLGLELLTRRHPVAHTIATAAATWTVLGGTSLGREATAVHDLLEVAGFLAAILVVSDVCSRAGLFAAAASLLTRRGSGPVRLMTTAFALAALVTAVLSLDATVVLLTPLVVAAARGVSLPTAPGSYACLRMANSGSLLLPVSNLTNLLAMSSLSLTFTGFAATMAPVLAAVLVVEYVGLRLLFRRPLAVPGMAAAPAPASAVVAGDVVVPATVVTLMLVGFAATSPLGVEPVWVAAVAAAVLLAWAGKRGLVGAADAARAAHLEFVLFVLALGVVVAAISAGFLGDLVTSLLPSGTGLAALVVVALLATALANLVTNLSATLLLVPLVAPLGDVAVLAALLGLNIGSGLTLTGSLANLLWRRTLARDGQPVSLLDFHRVSLALTPVSLLTAVAVLWLTT